MKLLPVVLRRARLGDLRLAVLALAVTVACQDPSSSAVPQEPTQAAQSDLRDTRRSEAVSDFNQVVASIDALYGPLTRKADRYGFDLDREAARTRATLAATGRSDSASFRAIKTFLDKLNDGHVSYTASILSDSSRQIGLPLLVTPIEGHYLVSALLAGAPAGVIARGDELIRIDGRTPHELARILDRQEGVPNPRTSEEITAIRITRRSFDLPAALLPAPGSAADLQMRRADGTRYNLNLAWASTRPPPRLQRPASAAKTPLKDPWAVVSDAIQDLTRIAGQAEAARVGANAPFFINAATVGAFGITPVRPSVATLTALGTPSCEGTSPPSFDCYQSFAGLFTHQGKRILVVRVPSYVPSAAGASANDPRYLRALFNDFQAQADVLVIDDTNNPGGSVGFATDLYSSLITRPATNVGFAFHADRKSINDFRGFADSFAVLGPPFATLAARYEGVAQALERAYDAGQELGPAVALTIYDLEDPRILPDPEVQWTKPYLVLANELSFSGGDLFPMLVQANRTGTIFGARTAGLGGSVEEVGVMPYSQASLTLTRSLFLPLDRADQVPFGSLVEDEGVTPDVPYTITVADFRSGYQGYVRAFADAAVRLTR
jgi:hypothetical protein